VSNAGVVALHFEPDTPRNPGSRSVGSTVPDEYRRVPTA
jgi:hypothetical protein